MASNQTAGTQAKNFDQLFGAAAQSQPAEPGKKANPFASGGGKASPQVAQYNLNVQTKEQASSSLSSNLKKEPYYTLVNEVDHFRVLCTTMDDYNELMRSDVLIIQKKGCVMYQRNREDGDDSGRVQYPTYGILGILNVGSHIFVILIIERRVAAKMPSGDFVYRITGVEFIPFDKNILNYLHMPQEIVKYVDGIKKILQEQGFYYSYHADITSSQQRQASIKNNKSFDKRYQWNHKIIKDFNFQNIDPFWTVPIIQGYVEQKTQIFDRQEIDVMLISRRRHAHAGARFISRGIDDNSNVANFVESELILTYDQHLYSFVQIRGSIPLFWEQKQKGLISHISIKRSQELTAHVFAGHLNDMIKDYSRVVMVNLVRKSKPEEDKLLQAFTSQLQFTPNQNVKHKWFDFHGETHGDNFHKVNQLMQDLQNVQSKFGFFVKERFGNQKVIKLQAGVFRTNCIDCLDRTNVTQAKISFRSVEEILTYIRAQSNRPKSNIDGSFGGFGQGDNFKVADQKQSSIFAGGPQGPIFESLKDIWVENGDYLSFQYTGTESNISRVTKQGGQGIMGKLEQWTIGATRFYQCVMNDDFKHQCIQFLAGEHPSLQKPYGIRNTLDIEVGRHKNQYTKQQNIEISVISWNCAGNPPPHSKWDVSDVLKGQMNQDSDIYIVGLQEMVELKTKEVIAGKDVQRAALWMEIITNSLNKNTSPGARYIPILQKVMVGQYIVMFVKEEHKDKINSIKKHKVKTGFSGMAGNKGSVALRFNFEDTSFAFVNVHLESGQKQIAERLENLRQIYNETFNDFSVSNTQEKCYIDYKCFFGDMNFRIDLPNQEVQDLIEQKNYARLLQYDQLLVNKADNIILNQFHEGDINFDPTYKYDRNCDVYDTSAKQRIPAWCDRVLFSRHPESKQQLVEKVDDASASKPVYYNRRDSYFSDHRPVLAVYKVPIVKIDRTAKEKFQDHILKSLLGTGAAVSKATLRQDSKQITAQDYQSIIGGPQKSQPAPETQTVSDLLDLGSSEPPKQAQPTTNTPQPQPVQKQEQNDILGLFDNPPVPQQQHQQLGNNNFDLPQVQMVGNPEPAQTQKVNPFGDFSKQPSQIQSNSQGDQFDQLFGGQTEEQKQGWAGKRNPFNQSVNNNNFL